MKLTQQCGGLLSLVRYKREDLILTVVFCNSSNRYWNVLLSLSDARLCLYLLEESSEKNWWNRNGVSQKIVRVPNCIGCHDTPTTWKSENLSYFLSTYKQLRLQKNEKWRCITKIFWIILISVNYYNFRLEHVKLKYKLNITKIA